MPRKAPTARNGYRSFLTATRTYTSGYWGGFVQGIGSASRMGVTDKYTLPSERPWNRDHWAVGSDLRKAMRDKSR